MLKLRNFLSIFLFIVGIFKLIFHYSFCPLLGYFIYPVIFTFNCQIVLTHTLRTHYARPAARPMDSYPNSGLGQVGPHSDFLPGAHVRVAVPLESGFQLLQLLAGEVSPLPPLLLLLGIVRVAVIAPVFGAPLLFCVSQIGG